ncbi:hypothetical protein ACJMK2_002231 [Sinanodonta woodiana]|uniref:C2H2-type domain-containing protein n=1 Tax=Sinanodonta woodiana TaxID=1069815 RepID=A0ABD3XY45_SINWO
MNRCDICHLSLNSPEQYQQHLGGKKHLDKLKAAGITPTPPPPKPPTIYGGSFVSAGYQGPHDPTQPPPPPPPPSSQGSYSMPSTNPVMKAVLDNVFGKLPTKRKQFTEMCNVCRVEFNSKQQLEQHLGGSKHAKKLRMSDISPVDELKCTLCDKNFTSVEQMQQHLKGKKHEKALEQKTSGNNGNNESNINTVLGNEVNTTPTTA